MKKLSKLLALFLSIAMLMTMLAIPAFAAEGDGEGGENAGGGEGGIPEATANSTIDTNLKGSITINKYEGNDTTKPLAGVTFALYKIADITRSQSGEVIVVPDTDLGNMTIDGDTTVTNVINALKGGDNNVTQEAALEKLTLTAEATTGANGQVKFENLDLGIYMVMETNAPAQIVNRDANFLVSVPMTNATGDAWVYDVVANPKNEAVRGGVKLKKTGKVAASSADSALEGAIFELYMQNANGGWDPVTKDSAGNPITNEMLTTSDSGLIQIDGLAPGKYYFKEIQVPNGSGYILDDVTTYEFEIDRDGKPVYPAGTAVDIGNNILAIAVVNEKPDMDKEVQKKDETWGDATDAARGETVTYRLKVNVPLGIANLLDFTLTDTMELQTFVANSLEVLESDGETVIYTQEQLSDAFKLDDKTWTIEFNSHTTETVEGKETIKEISTLLGDYAGEQIIVMFDATLDADAVVAPGGNDNNATLEYTNEWSYEGQPVSPEPSNDRIEDEVTVYTFKIQVVKTDGGTKKLAGAEFDLYEEVEEGTQGAVQNPVAGLTGTYKKINTTSLVTDDNGEITVEGLDNGEYWLVETKAPTYKVGDETKSYNLLKDPVKVTLAVQYTVTTETTTTYDEDGNVTSKETVIKTETFNGEIEEGVYGQSTTVVNRKGFELPKTGGMGTILFSVIGGMLILCGAAIIFRSKKTV